MNNQISSKLIAVVVAVLMNGAMLGSVSYLFAPSSVAMAQSAQLLSTPITRGII